MTPYDREKTPWLNSHTPSLAKLQSEVRIVQHWKERLWDLQPPALKDLLCDTESPSDSPETVHPHAHHAVHSTLDILISSGCDVRVKKYT